MLIGLKSPGLYLQGSGILKELYTHIHPFGERALVLISPSGRKRHGEELQSSLKSHGFSCIYEEIKAECCSQEIERIISTVKPSVSSVRSAEREQEVSFHGEQSSRDRQPDMVIGMGGGKILDIAKAVAHGLRLPCIILPTVASTDAPCSSMSVLYTPEGVYDRYSFLTKGPDAVIVDTDIILHAPERLLATGMGDALSTYYEARAVQRSSSPNQINMVPTSAAFALGKCCCETLMTYGEEALACVREQRSGLALEKVVEANIYLSGVGFESGGVAAAHALSKGMTVVPALHRIAHGESVAFDTIVQLCLEDAPEKELTEVIGFCRMAGLPVCFADLSEEPVSREDWMRVAEFTCRPGMTIHKMPFKVTPDMLVEAIYRADERGRQSRCG